jgi:hypothetical protein
MMKLKYIGVSFGIDGLTNGKIYDAEYDAELDVFRVIDDSGDAYMYSTTNPRPLAAPDHPGGHWDIIEK